MDMKLGDHKKQDSDPCLVFLFFIYFAGGLSAVKREVHTTASHEREIQKTKLVLSGQHLYWLPLKISFRS